jgi:hypothetical protein
MIQKANKLTSQVGDSGTLKLTRDRNGEASPETLGD